MDIAPKNMAYSVSKESLIPMLFRCIIRHGSLEAVSNYPSKVSERGEDATVCEEFIALNSIRRYDDADDMIQSALEKVVVATYGALEEAEGEIKDLKNSAASQPAQPRSQPSGIPHLKYILSWFVVVGIAAWMNEENFSATLASTIVIAGTGLLCFLAYLNRRTEPAKGQ